MVQGDQLACEFPGATAGDGRHRRAEADALRPQGHRGERDPWVVRPHIRRVVVDNVVFEEDAVPARLFRQLGQVGEGARVAARPGSGDLQAIAHMHLLGPESSLRPSHWQCMPRLATPPCQVLPGAL